MLQAASRGHLECLQYLHQLCLQRGSDNVFKHWRCFKIISSGHLHCLQYVVKNGKSVNVQMCETAALSGQIECLQYLFSQCTIRDEGICVAATDAGQLECLKLAIASGCVAGHSTRMAAASLSSCECLEYLLISSPTFALTSELNAQTCRAGSLVCLKWLLQLGCPVDHSEVIAAVMCGSIACSEYLLHLGYHVLLPSTFYFAVEAGHLSMVQWLVEHKCPYTRSYALYLASQTPTSDCFHYLQSLCRCFSGNFCNGHKSCKQVAIYHRRTVCG